MEFREIYFGYLSAFPHKPMPNTCPLRLMHSHEPWLDDSLMKGEILKDHHTARCHRLTQLTVCQNLYCF